MCSDDRPADFSRLRLRPLAGRAHKVGVNAFARPADPAESFSAWLDALPDVLAARELRELAAAIVAARQDGRRIVWACGAHVIKVGLAPLLIDLMQRRCVDALVLNGACAIHDWEIAAVGATSEEVGPGLDDGSFGMVTETGNALHAAAAEAARRGEGLGSAIARAIAESDLPYRERSLIGACHRLGVPVTVHVAIGADTIHAHPEADGAAIGAATFVDFRRLVSLVAELDRGVWVHCGSAVLLPETFLKALSAARNLGHEVRGMTTASLDMQRHYRVRRNVLERPTRDGGRSIELIGHHELLLPLLAAAIRAAGG